MFSKSEQGQTLLEVLMAMTVGILIVGALTIATVTSIRNTQFSQSQTQATKLAQEGVEVVRAIRDRDGPIATGTVSCQPGVIKFSSLWSQNLGPAPQTLGSFNGYFVLANLTTTPQLNCVFLNSANPSGQETINNNSFYRYLVIEDNGNSSPDYTRQKKITVVVGWTDAIGNHQSKLQTLLTNH